MTEHHHPGFQVPERDRPTRAQLRYLRDLAMQSGQSFTPPKTKAEASDAIRRLKRARTTRRGGDAALRAAYDSDGARRGTAVRDHEITGYGATARWA
jgi:hypothetical protein